VDGLQCYGQQLSTILNRIRGSHGTTLELKVKKVCKIQPFCYVAVYMTLQEWFAFHRSDLYFD
jgi:hypothetical protein